MVPNKIITLLLATSYCYSLPAEDRATSKSTCGYESCHPVKEGYFNIHLVPHTHDDVGWLKTVDQYYYGGRDYIQQAGVQYILDSVLESLREDPDRRFIYVETAFLWKWWTEQSESKRNQFKELIENGQLEIIGGGWSMNDEAVTHYQSIIDQFSHGFRKLNETFGKCSRPKVGWQIDPFGHSREMASIFAQLGFDGLFLGRIDYQDKIARINSKTLEMIWKSSDTLDYSNIFTGVLYNLYSPPSGFCFDILCTDDPIIDDVNSPDYNLDSKISVLLFHYLDRMIPVHRTSNVLITMGGDFHYQYANKWFKNMDKLIKYVNQKQEEGFKYNLIYSTPSCYLKAVHDESVQKGLNWTVKSDDFFPYASDVTAYWTGYFTSRPTIKYYERKGNNFLQVCKQLYVQASLDSEHEEHLNALREAMGVMQHHDAITGTEKQQVAEDYARLLSLGFDKCAMITSSALSALSKEELQTDVDMDLSFESCNLLNISQCALTEINKNFVVTVYNPLSRPINFYVRLPVVAGDYEVLDPEGNYLSVDLIPISNSTLNIPGRNSTATHELLFLGEKIPALGYKLFYVKQTSTGISELKSSSRRSLNELGFENNSTTTKLTYDEETGFITSVTMNNKTIPLTQEFDYYYGTIGSNSDPNSKASGAYIFRPNASTYYKVSAAADVDIFEGKLVTELRQVFSSWVSQIVRIYKNENYIEFDWIVGPIPDGSDVNGKEVITRYITNLNTSSTFYTDSNGRQLLKRVLNYRPTWDYQVHEKIAGNYYPVTSKILIQDEENDIEVAVLTDRAQGGTSLSDGEIELMLHRRCFADDSLGVAESLKETAFGQNLVARGSHYLVTGSLTETIDGKTIAALERDIAQRKLLSAWIFLSSTNDLSFEEYKSLYKLEYSGLTGALPDNVQILTLEPWTDGTVLLRLEHVLEAGEDPNLSLSVTVDLRNLFTKFNVISIKETTLGGNQWLEDNDRLRFQGETESEVTLGTREDVSDFQVTLKPMQIRTFIIEIETK